MRKLLIVLLGSFVVVVASGWLDGGLLITAKQASTIKAPGGDLKKRFVGTWRLVNIELLGPNGELLPAPASPVFGSPNPIGFIMHDPAGYMGMTIMQSGRAKYAGAQPTPEEARAALAGYTAYFGTFSVSEADGVVTHHVQGSLNPNETGSDKKCSFEFSGNRLILNAPRGPTGAQSRLIWERVPDLPTLTPTHRQFIGFWKQVSSERRKTNGELFSSNPRLPTGFVIFTTSGHMAVHSMQPGRKPFATAQPTPEEARVAVTTYGGAYFGPYAIHEGERFEVTHQIGVINPGQVGMFGQRHYEFAGPNRLILKPPPETIDGQKVQGFITWERVSAEVTSSR